MEFVEQSFVRGELVWAKLSGFPWWPGAIVQVESDQKDASISTCLVKFFGENSHSVLPLPKVAKYSSFFSQFSKKANSNRKLKQSIEIAEKIINGKLSVQKQLQHVKVSLLQTKSIKQQLKTAVSIEDFTKECFEIESTEISCCPSVCVPLKTIEPSGYQSILANSQMTRDDWQVMEELEQSGINQTNVVNVLQYGLIDRYASINKKKAEKMRQTAKKFLMKKYFPKFLLKKSSLPQQQCIGKQKNQKSIKLVKTKLISKLPKESKIATPRAQVQSLCIKKLFTIFKIYNIDSQTSRCMSLAVVQKLKNQYPLQSKQFQISYLQFIDWAKHHSRNPKTIEQKYTGYFQLQIQSNETTTECVINDITSSC